MGRLGSPDAWPTGYALGAAIEEYHGRTKENVLVISLDGDTIQVLSGIRGVFTRTVTPVDRVEQKNLRRHLPSARLAQSSEDVLGNWKIRPHVLPRTWDELAIFLAIYKEAVRVAMKDHKASSIELRGIHRQRQISETFQVNVSGGDTLVRMERIGKIVFMGYMSKLLSPQSLVSLAIDGADPGGITEVLLDSGDAVALSGSLTRLGVAARFEDQLRPLGVLVSPGRNEERVNAKRAYMERGGTLEVLPVEPDAVSVMSVGDVPNLTIVMDPPNNKVDFGEGDGHKVRREFRASFPAIYLDGRGRRPKADAQVQDVQKWYRGLRVFPPEVISGWMGGKQ